MRGCDHCVFFHELATERSGGECRRYPPVILSTINDYNGDFPIVQSTMWCGEFKEMSVV